MTPRQAYWLDLRYKILRFYRNQPWFAWYRRWKLRRHVKKLLRPWLPFPPVKRCCKLRFLYQIDNPVGVPKEGYPGTVIPPNFEVPPGFGPDEETHIPVVR